jgi:HSP20 family protein
MFTTRWQPFNPVWNQLTQLRNEVTRMFDRWGDNGTQAPMPTLFPAVNIWEEGDSILVEAELPGLEMNDLEIFVTGADQLTLKGERKAQVPAECSWHRQERGFGSFVRVLTLPIPVDANRVEAQLEHGVLRLKLAKHDAAKPRKIPVKAS